MNACVRIACLPILVLVAGCAATSTHFDWDRHFDFTKLHTWTWLAKSPGAAPDDLVTQRVRSAIESELAARGYREVESNADFQVTWHVQKRDEMRATADYGYRDPNAGYWTGYYGPRTAGTQYYAVGTLVVDVIDPTENRLVWRGTASHVFDRPPGPDRIDEVVQDAVKKLLDGFPPEG